MKKASFEIPSSLFYALLVALLIIAFYITTSEYPRKEAGKLYGPQGNAAAYSILKKVCANWASYIGLCESCDCTNCQEAFLQELSVFSAYYVPYYVSASGLAVFDPSTEKFSPNPEICASVGGDCGRETALCAGALTGVFKLDPSSIGEPSSEIKKALYPITDQSDPKAAEVQSSAKAKRAQLRSDYSGPCAKVCLWVAKRAQECALGASECASRTSASQNPLGPP